MMIDEELGIDAGTEAIINALREIICDFTQWQKDKLIEKLMEERCDDCGSKHLPCYCHPCYDI